MANVNLIQPVDHGVIKSVKRSYHKIFMLKFILGDSVEGVIKLSKQLDLHFYSC